MANAEQKLSSARKICEERGVRFTTSREHVFLLLAQDNSSFGAYDLLEQLQKSDPKAKPPTVYRALEFLMEQGFVHKVESENAFVLCSHFTQQHPAQLLICDCCGYIQEIDPSSIKSKIEQVADEHGFKVQHPTIELHGFCHKCAKHSEQHHDKSCNH